MSKAHYPVTPAIRFLRAGQIGYTAMQYPYEEHGGTAHCAACLDLDEHAVIKTIVLENENRQGLIVLMHGDRQISTRNLARQLAMRHIQPATPEQARKWTGYFVGGTSPFGCKTALPVYAERGIWDLPVMHINGGRRGLLVSVAPSPALAALGAQPVDAAAE
ncbi:MAG: YbaK/EbsC family protein [Neisseria sp.]|nr:YbaK/EbsC family protein [Neisseria sp.]